MLLGKPLVALTKALRAISRAEEDLRAEPSHRPNEADEGVTLLPGSSKQLVNGCACALGVRIIAPRANAIGKKLLDFIFPPFACLSWAFRKWRMLRHAVSTDIPRILIPLDLIFRPWRFRRNEIRLRPPLLRRALPAITG